MVHEGAANATDDGLYFLSPFNSSSIILATDVSLSDILTPGNLSPLFNNHPDLIPALFPHIPPDLPVPPSDDVIQRII